MFQVKVLIHCSGLLVFRDSSFLFCIVYGICLYLVVVVCFSLRETNEKMDVQAKQTDDSSSSIAQGFRSSNAPVAPQPSPVLRLRHAARHAARCPGRCCTCHRNIFLGSPTQKLYEFKVPQKNWL